MVVEIIGSQTPDSIHGIRRDVETALQRSSSKNILVLAEGAGVTDLNVLQLATDAMLALPIRCMAVAGANPDRISSARIVTKAGDDEKRFKLFRLEEDAREWLDSRK